MVSKLWSCDHRATADEVLKCRQHSAARQSPADSDEHLSIQHEYNTHTSLYLAKCETALGAVPADAIVESLVARG